MHPDTLTGNAGPERELWACLAAAGMVSLPGPEWADVRLELLARLAAKRGTRIVMLHDQTSPPIARLDWIHGELGTLRAAITGELRPHAKAGDTFAARLYALEAALADHKLFDPPIARVRRILILVDPGLDSESARQQAARVLAPHARRLLLVQPGPYGLVGGCAQVAAAAGLLLPPAQPSTSSRRDDEELF